jgi:hypothetical protein
MLLLEHRGNLSDLMARPIPLYACPRVIRRSSKAVRVPDSRLQDLIGAGAKPREH